MENKIEISPYGNMLVYKKGYMPDFVKDAIDKHKLEGLRIFDHLDRLDNLDFLKEYNFLKKLDIDCMNDHDYGFLGSLPHLIYLGIGPSLKQLNTINLSKLVKLETLAIQWRKKIEGLENCTSLSSLTIVEFKERDFHKIECLKNITELHIKTASIETLGGIDKFNSLNSLSIGYCKKLQSIKSINHLSKLKEFKLDTCPNINDYEEVTDLPNLRTLSLTNCGKIQSLKFIEPYNSLSKLSLLGNTVIGDGDLLPAKRIQSLEHKHYSHYNVKLDNRSYDQNIKNNLAKIRKLFK